MPSIERIFSPRKKTDAGVHAWSDGHAVGIIAAPRGEEGNSFPVWYSADGVTFAEGSLDYSGTKVDHLNEFDGGTLVPSGRIFKRRNRSVFEAELGVQVTFRPAFEFPDHQSFEPRCILAHQDGTLWLGGHCRAQPDQGWVYARSNGEDWARAADKLPGSVGGLAVHMDGVLALAWRSVLQVSLKDSEELAKFKDVVTGVHLDERGLLAFGDTFTAFVAGGKRPRYGKLLGEEDRATHNRTRVACAGGAFVMWARGALHCSHDGLGWSAVAGPSSLNLRSLVPSAAGVLAVSSDADVFVFVP